MVKEVSCPFCEAEVKNTGENPVKCGACQGLFNIVTRSVKFRISGMDREMDEKIKIFSQAGQFFMEALFRRLLGFYLIPKEEGACSVCGETKNLTMESVSRGEKYCSSCGKDLAVGKAARTEILPGAKIRFGDLPKTYTDMAFSSAQAMFQNWLGQNWANILRQDQYKMKFRECRERLVSEGGEGEPEIKRIREEWGRLKGPVSLPKFFEVYKGGRRITKKNRRKRRLRLGELRSRFGTYTEIMREVAKPVCGECEHFREYEWGLECALDAERKKSARPAKLPDFPTSKVKISKASYDIEKEKITFKARKKKDAKVAMVIGGDWIRDSYGGGDFFKDNERYPDVVRVRRPGRKEEVEYFFIYPLTETVPLKPGSYRHIIVYGPETTAVVSLNGEGREVKFFRHDAVAAIKQYYSRQREEASRGYFRKPRLKEQRKIKLLLHEESKSIADWLRAKPGRVLLANIQKKKYERSVDGRKELNKKLGYWNDSIFRPLVKYKLELAGLSVEEMEFDITQLAECPYCGEEAGGSWQELLISQGRKSISCPCGKDTNTILAIALNILNDAKASSFFIRFLIIDAVWVRMTRGAIDKDRIFANMAVLSLPKTRKRRFKEVNLPESRAQVPAPRYNLSDPSGSRRK